MTSIQIDHRIFDYQTSIEATIACQAKQNYYCNLPYLNVIEVIGEQAQSFLQGQLTNDINQVVTGELQPNLLCNLKGQIISKLWVGKHQHFFLICPTDLNADILGLLSKIAALSKVQLTPSPTIKVIGLFQNQTLSLSINPPPLDFVEKPNLFWHYQSVLQLHGQIYPLTCRQFLPHHLQLEQHGWINFQKGCYRGQEIIARMHYLGKSKYQAKTYVIKTNASLSPGDLLINNQDQQIGELVDFSPINSQEYLILVCIKNQSIHESFKLTNK